MKEDARRLVGRVRACLPQGPACAVFSPWSVFVHQQERFMTPATLSDAGAIALSPLPQVIAAIAAGQPVLVLDDAGRENEADLIVAADRIKPRNHGAADPRGAAASSACASAPTRRAR
jgi:hypothetical protein